MSHSNQRPPSRRPRRDPETVPEALARHNERQGFRDAMRERGRSRRERPAKSALSREAILNAAMAILDREGVAALSMRRLALELDTGAASLYVYFRNREDLLGSVVDRAFEAVEIPDPAVGEWQDRVRAVILGGIAALQAHRGLAAASMSMIPSGEAQLRMSSYMIDCLREGGMGDQQIAWAIDLLGLLSTAIVIEQDDLDERLGSVNPDQTEHWLASMMNAMPMDRYPNTVIFPYYLSMDNIEERVGWFIDVVLAGVTRMPPPPPSDAPHPYADIFEKRMAAVTPPPASDPPPNREG